METLSTLATLSRWEKEVNNLGGYTEKWGLVSPSSGPAYTISVSADVANGIFTYAAGGTVSVAPTVTKLAIPTSQVVSVALYDISSELLDTLAMNEGHGIYLFGANGIETGKLSDASAWTVCQATRTWQDKVDLAHIVVENDILTNLYNRLSKYTDTEIMDGITNIETMAIPVDMKSLELIYTDLANSGFNQMYQAKAADYARRYNAEFRNALQRLNVDIYGTGEEPQRIVTQGVLSR